MSKPAATDYEHVVIRLARVGLSLWWRIRCCSGVDDNRFRGRPAAKIHDLRGEVIRRATEFVNIPGNLKELREAPGEFERIEHSEEDTNRSKEAQRVLRDLGAQMRTFAENEPLAAWLVRLRYNSVKASAGLIGWSNTFDVYGESKA